jgi:FAD:protein FMN transferase
MVSLVPTVAMSVVRSLLPWIRRAPRFLMIAVTVIVVMSLAQTLGAETERDVRLKMGSRFEITAVHQDAAHARAAITAAYDEIDRIEALISSWQDGSETSAVNRQAGVAPVVVSEELFNLVRRSLKVSELTDGAFDITFGSVGQLWDFTGQESALPDPDRLANAMRSVGSDHIVLDEVARSVHLLHPDTRIGFGAIGKGYAANRAVAVLRSQGIESGVVNAGGDLLVFGRREDGEARVIGVADPRDPGQIFAHLRIADLAIVTSGDYERFTLIGGRRYAHILDPRTGYPVDHTRSVTIVCPDAELADALATAVFVLGPTEGLALVDQLRGIEGFVVDAAGELHTSRSLTSLFAEQESEQETVP